MLRLNRVIRPWNESGALNPQINLYGFWNEQAFLTKSGDLGMVLKRGLAHCQSFSMYGACSTAWNRTIDRRDSRYRNRTR